MKSNLKSYCLHGDGSYSSVKVGTFYCNFFHIPLISSKAKLTPIIDKF